MLDRVEGGGGLVDDEDWFAAGIDEGRDGTAGSCRESSLSAAGAS